jgi:hypothetical protein
MEKRLGTAEVDISMILNSECLQSISNIEMFIFGGTQNYFGGTSRFRVTQVEKHWLKESSFLKISL